MKKNSIKELQNFYFFPFLMILFQFGFLFVALISSGYYFEKKVLLSTFLLTCLWGSLFGVSVVKGKSIKLNFNNYIIIFLFVLCCFCLIRYSWFSHYLRIDAVKRLFEGKTFIDTLYHSSIAESIVTNGYPSIQQNAPIFLAYHCLSHYFIAGLSKVLNIPCFITYNYIFPVIIIPLLIFLLQKVIFIGKLYFSEKSFLDFSDYIILFGFILGFLIKQIQSDIGCNLTVNVFNSESCLVSIVISLLYFCVIDRGYRKIKNFDNINLFILIPFFIIILSYSKVSFGCIFTLGASYYVFRKYFLNNKKCLLMIVFLFIFIIYYIIIRKISIITNYSSTNIVSGKSFQLFNYPRAYCKNNFCIFLHYLFLFFPILIIIYRKKAIFLKNFLAYKKERLFIEMCFLLMLGACLPGVFLIIPGGSAFYFVIPVYFFSWILFISCCSIKIEKKNVIFQNKKIKYNIFIIIVFLLVFSTSLKDMHFKDSMIQTLRSRISLIDFKKNIPSKIKEIFRLPASIQFQKEYIVFNLIRQRVSNNPIDYCIFVSATSDFTEHFDNYLLLSQPTTYYIRPYFAISAYCGVPVINSMYERNGYFYRGDGKIFGEYKQVSGYSIPPALCDIKITKENMKERAKALGKKYIIVLENNYYTVTSVDKKGE